MINNLTYNKQLYPAEVGVEKKKSGLGRILNYNIIYFGNGSFIVNPRNSVKDLNYLELIELLKHYEPFRIRRFQGTNRERQQAINKALSRLREKYNLIFFNCEYFANWVQKGKESSIQAAIVFISILLGFTCKLIKTNNGER